MFCDRSSHPDPRRQWLRRALAATLPASMFLTRGWGTSKVCLTFDDGPHPEHTPRVLDALAAHGVRATFFVVGQNAEKHRNLLKRIVEAGHEIGNHSWSHPDPERVSARELDDEALRTDALLEELTGRRPAAFRPPRGKITASGLLRLWRRRRTLALWSVDPRDYEAASAEDLRRRVRAQQVEAGDIVLLHDVHPWIGDAVDHFVPQARARGLTFGTLSEVVGRAGGPHG